MDTLINETVKGVWGLHWSWMKLVKVGHEKKKLEDNIMNLTNFLKQIDSLTAKYTAKQLASFIHDAARVLPEKHRADFLKRLKEADAAEQDVQEKRNQCSVSTIGSAYEAYRFS